MEVKFYDVFECCYLLIDSYWNSRYKIKKYNYVCTFTFAILIAVSYSTSSDKLDVMFLRSIRKKVFNIKIWFTYISFSSSNRVKFFEKDNCLVHMQIWCILATCSEAKVYPTSAFQLMLVSKIKKWFHLLLFNFSSRWNNSKTKLTKTRYKNFGDSLKQLKTTPSYL